MKMDFSLSYSVVISRKKMQLLNIRSRQYLWNTSTPKLKIEHFRARPQLRFNFLFLKLFYLGYIKWKMLLSNFTQTVGRNEASEPICIHLYELEKWILGCDLIRCSYWNERESTAFRDGCKYVILWLQVWSVVGGLGHD